MYIMKKQKLPLFQSVQPKAPSKVTTQSALLKNDCCLFSHFYIACKTWNIDLQTFFRHENQATPSSFAEDTMKLYSGTKSDLVACLTDYLATKDKQTPTYTMIQQPVAEPIAPKVYAITVDGVAVVNMLYPAPRMTLEDYAIKRCVLYVSSLLKVSDRVDIELAAYWDGSLKKQECMNKGEGMHKKVIPSSRVPNKWASFLWVDENKTELLYYSVIKLC